jgi:hypothetical protein
MTIRFGPGDRLFRRAALAGLAAGLAVLSAVALPGAASATPDQEEPPAAGAPLTPRYDDKPDRDDSSDRDDKGSPDDGSAADDGADTDDGGGTGATPGGSTDSPGSTDPSGFAPFEDATILPGAVLTGTEGGQCTGNFIYTTGDSVLIGYAAHCPGGGGASDINGCTTPPGELGVPVAITGTDGAVSVGTLVYSSWIAMQANGETDVDLCELNDFALVEIDPADVAKVNPTVPLFGGPEGLDTDGTETGERVFSYQPNILTSTPAKQGVSQGDMRGGLTHIVMTMPPGVMGDSGSGYLDAEGDAFGSLSTLLLEADGTPVANGVTDLAMALDYANEFGGIGEISLVTGTEPFSPQGVMMTPLPDLSSLDAGPDGLGNLIPTRP